jgi:hypothetical protein
MPAKARGREDIRRSMVEGAFQLRFLSEASLVWSRASEGAPSVSSCGQRENSPWKRGVYRVEGGIQTLYLIRDANYIKILISVKKIMD